MTSPVSTGLGLARCLFFFGSSTHDLTRHEWLPAPRAAKGGERPSWIDWVGIPPGDQSKSDLLMKGGPEVRFAFYSSAREARGKEGGLT